VKIVRAALHQVRLPLVHEFQTSSHRKNFLEHLLVELTDDDGATGWGEVACGSDPFYAPDTVFTSWHVAATYLLPAVVGVQVDHPAEVRAAYRKVRGHHFAAAGVDTAAWSLWTAAQGVPLARALGGERTEVVAGVSLGIEPTIDALLEQVRHHHVESGYPRVKLKIAPGWDVEPVRAVREAFGDDLLLHVDANGAYSADQIPVLRELDEFGLTMIEQPFAPRAFTTSAQFQREVSTPVCLDESIDSLDDLRTAQALGAGRVLNVKVSRMGGLSAAVAAHDLAVEFGWPAWVGGMHEFGVGRAANVALSSLPGFSLPSDVSASEKYYARDVTTPVTATDGVVRVSTDPGLGVVVDEEFLRENRVRHEEFTA
jgi:o-succinylbenzoate synthase